MATIFTDRQSAYPNRYKVTDDSGKSYYVTLERADEPTVIGTPLTAETLNKLVGPPCSVRTSMVIPFRQPVRPGESSSRR